MKHSESVNKYNTKAYDRLAINVYKGERDIIKRYAESKGKSINQYINDLIEKDCVIIRRRRASD